MKLQRLHIKGFRNIDDLDFDLSNQNGLSVLIGNNGSGKSNILEAIVAIFASLYSKSKRFTPSFDYEVEYTIQETYIKVKKLGEKISVNDTEVSKKELSKLLLPKNVIACYSGETLRLQETYFKPFRRHYVHDIIRNKSELNSLKLLFINKDMWDISLLVLFLHDFDVFKEIEDFCHNVLNIKRITSINFELAPKHLTKTNAAKQLIDAISPNGDKSVVKTVEEFSNIIDRLGMTSMKEVFMALYVGLYSHGIKSIDIELESKNGKKFKANLLSEGEKKLLSVFTMLEVLGDESSLMIYDEPDSQIHISRKSEIKKLVERYDNRQHIITTHSPTLASAFFDSSEHLNCLTKNTNGFTEKIDKDKYALIAELTDNIWNVSEQNTFLASNKPITLLVEGKTDKVHIEEAFKRLKDGYPELYFDVFAMNSSEHIREVLIGLSCSEIKWDKKFIGIFDNDSAGQKDIGNGFEKEDGKEQIKHVKYKDGIVSTNFYAFLLPIAVGYNKKDGFTIENCYSPDKYEQAVVQAIAHKQGHFAGLSIDKIAEDIKNKSKILLADRCKSFEKKDFDGFKPVFDMIEEIRQL